MHLPTKLQGRFSVRSAMSEGIDNPGLQLHENCLTTSRRDGVSDVVNNSTCLHENPGRRRRSLVQLTREALPRLENYRNSKRALKRPSLGELHEGNDFVKVLRYNNLLTYTSNTRARRSLLCNSTVTPLVLVPIHHLGPNAV